MVRISLSNEDVSSLVRVLDFVIDKASPPVGHPTREVDPLCRIESCARWSELRNRLADLLV